MDPMTGIFHDPEESGDEVAAMPYDPTPTNDPHSAITRVRDENEQRLLAIEGVKGIGVGRDRIGGDALIVYALDASVKACVPSEIEGYPVEVIVTGEIDAL
jgi:hypothetical protein